MILIKYIFIDPVKELREFSNIPLYDLINTKERTICHYTQLGHEQILKVYKKYINKLC